MKHRIISPIALVGAFALVVLIPTPAFGSGDGRSAMPKGGAIARTMHERLVTNVDLEGPPVVLPGTDEAFALRGNNGEEVAAEPLERIDLSSGKIAVGPEVPEDAEVGVDGRRLIVLAPRRYGTDGIASGPWRIWTVDPNTLKLELPVVLSFVSSFGAVIALVDPAPSSAGIWVSNGVALRLVDPRTGRVMRTVKIPALSLSVDPTGQRLYVLTATGDSTASGTAYRAGTVVELNDRTGAVVASTQQWTSSSHAVLAASVTGVFLVNTGRVHSPVVMLAAQNLRPTDLPSALESRFLKAFQHGDAVTVTPFDDEVVILTSGQLTCLGPGTSKVRVSVDLGTTNAVSVVFAQRGDELFTWSASSLAGSSRIEVEAVPPTC